MSWLAFQSSFLLTCKTLECKVYFVDFSQVSPVQFHLYAMILQFPPCPLNQKQLKEDLIWAVSTAQGLVKHFLENSHEQNPDHIGNSWDFRLWFSDFCWVVLQVSCPLDICGSRSDFQHCLSAPVYFWLLCAILLHDPIGVWCTLVYHCCWFPCSILPVLDPNWCT